MENVLTNGELSPNLKEFLSNQVDLSIWDGERNEAATGFLVYGHPHLGPDELDKLPNLRVISNFGVGVDHIDLDAARERNIQVGNTPGFVDHATADMTFALLMAAARNVVKGDHHARSKANSTTTTPTSCTARKSTAPRSASLAWATLARRWPAAPAALT